MALPFTWPGKKEGSEPSGSSSKLEFPEALAAQGPPELKPKSESPHAAGKDDAADLRDLTARYGQLSMLMEQANQQVLAYLIERQSQADAKPADSVSKKLEACMSKLELMAVGSAGTIAEKFDALAGKLDKLSVVAPASGRLDGRGCPCRRCGDQDGPATAARKARSHRRQVQSPQ